MGVWDLYEERLEHSGKTARDAALRREKMFLTMRTRDSLSYQIANVDGEDREVAIIGTDNLNTKFIYSMPNETLKNGGLVRWADNYWLITEKDAATEVYTKCKMLQCNYLLRWVDKASHKVCEQWCVVEDGTKYLTGEFEDRHFVVTRGDSRISVTIAKTPETVALQRDDRFLIDEPESNDMLAYILTKPLKLGGTFNGEGVYAFVMQECNREETDNQDLRIANYYKYFPFPDTPPEKPEPKTNKKVWL